MGRVAGAAFAGTAIEFYDFFIFGTATALVFGKEFFGHYGGSGSVLDGSGQHKTGYRERQADCPEQQVETQDQRRWRRETGVGSWIATSRRTLQRYSRAGMGPE